MIVFHICFVNRHQIASLSLDFVMDFLCTSQNRFTCCLIFWIKRTHTQRGCPALEGKTSIAPLRSLEDPGWGVTPAAGKDNSTSVCLHPGDRTVWWGLYSGRTQIFFGHEGRDALWLLSHVMFRKKDMQILHVVRSVNPKLRWTVEFSSRRTCWMTCNDLMTSRNMCKSMAFLWPPCNLTLQDPGGQRLHGGFRDPGAVGTSWTVEGMAAEIGGWGLGDVGGVWIYGDFMVT